MKNILSIGCMLLVALSLSACEVSQKNDNNAGEEIKKETADIVDKYQDNQSTKGENILEKTIKNPKIALVALDGSKLALKSSLSKFGCDDNLVYKEINGEFTPQQILEAMFTFRDLETNDLYYNVFASSNLIVDSLEIDEEGLVILKLSGDLMIGGMCDTPRVFAQINSTLTVIDTLTIKGVEVFINGELMSDFLSEEG